MPFAPLRMTAAADFVGICLQLSVRASLLPLGAGVHLENGGEQSRERGR